VGGFAIDVLACSECGRQLRLIATLHDPAVIRKIIHTSLSRISVEGTSAAIAATSAGNPRVWSRPGRLTGRTWPSCL
jgi:hypothetical protein